MRTEQMSQEYLFDVRVYVRERVIIKEPENILKLFTPKKPARSRVKRPKWRHKYQLVSKIQSMGVVARTEQEAIGRIQALKVSEVSIPSRDIVLIGSRQPVPVLP